MQQQPDRRPTLDDVANRVGVSTATVSRCLSAPEKVRPKLREKVMAAITETGYRPHGAARALASRRTNTIGAVIPTLDNAIFAKVAQTLQDALDVRGRTLLLASSDYLPEREQNQIENLIIRGVDGIMLTGEQRDPEIYELLDRRGIRYVNTYVHHPDSPHPTIGFDNVGAMEKIVSYLYDLGHRRFAMIGGLTAGNDRAAERIQGTREALQRRSIDLPPERILECPYALTAGRTACRALLAAAEPPTAIVCGNDVLALGTLFEAAALGTAVPGSLSITGFDDLELAREIAPGLTTIHAPLVEMGRLAADFLLSEADSGAEQGRHIELPAELVVRGSTGPVSV
ncbi:substrate-binding domain-containing protein [Pelagibius litoralis]|uniref:Substrate-binding domain-containing protein n=1 Tax=Pelagibius litoralis TaxID=374515 RepID=A0A967EZ19_9PROT|nr:LacI family DNA-binding transcriptional regulator [Pelagibius litoralis]NIA69980.1 substrate-binding domain-containing protein [Pelagibius litoralis]